MDHWLMKRVLEGKTYDHVWGFPADVRDRHPAAPARKARRIRSMLARRPVQLRPAGARA